MEEAKWFYLYDPVTHKYLRAVREYEQPDNSTDISPINMADPVFDLETNKWVDNAPIIDDTPTPSDEMQAINRLAQSMLMHDAIQDQQLQDLAKLVSQNTAGGTN